MNAESLIYTMVSTLSPDETMQGARVAAELQTFVSRKKKVQLVRAYQDKDSPLWLYEMRIINRETKARGKH